MAKSMNRCGIAWRNMMFEMTTVVDIFADAGSVSSFRVSKSMVVSDSPTIGEEQERTIPTWDSISKEGKTIQST